MLLLLDYLQQILENNVLVLWQIFKLHESRSKSTSCIQEFLILHFAAVLY